MEKIHLAGYEFCSPLRQLRVSSCLSYVCLTHLHWMYLIQEIGQDVCLPLIGSRQKVCRQEECQDICLPLIGPDGKHGGLMGVPLYALTKRDSPFPMDPE